MFLNSSDARLSSTRRRGVREVSTLETTRLHKPIRRTPRGRRLIRAARKRASIAILDHARAFLNSLDQCRYFDGGPDGPTGRPVRIAPMFERIPTAPDALQLLTSLTMLPSSESRPIPAM